MLHRWTMAAAVGVSLAFVSGAQANTAQSVGVSPQTADYVIGQNLWSGGGVSTQSLVASMSPTMSLDDAVKAQTARESGDISAEKRCLTEAVYFESRGEKPKAQFAVARVILNRQASGLYPGTVCGVVNQPGQFTFPRRPVAVDRDALWLRARAVASLAMSGFRREIASSAMFFHSASSRPRWTNRARLIGAIGGNLFYAQR